MKPCRVATITACVWSVPSSLAKMFLRFAVIVTVNSQAPGDLLVRLAVVDEAQDVRFAGGAALVQRTECNFGRDRAPASTVAKRLKDKL